MKGKFSSLCFLFLIFLCGSGCGEIVPVWVGESQLADYTLYYTEPVDFLVEVDPIEATMDLRLELEITYYQGIGRNTLPLFIVIQDKDREKEVREFTVDVPLRTGDEWLGIPSTNEIDYVLTHNAINHLSFQQGLHTLKIFTNDEEEEKIYGIVKIVARLFENTPDFEG